MCNELLILGKYDHNNGIVFGLNYKSIPEGLTGVSVNQIYYDVQLLSVYDNSKIGTIKFIDTIQKEVTNEKTYYVIENITINIDLGGTIYANNYYSGKSYSYTPGDKIIIPITSCTGNFVGKKGYIVIDVTENIRYVTIRLDD